MEEGRENDLFLYFMIIAVAAAATYF